MIKYIIVLTVSDPQPYLLVVLYYKWAREAYPLIFVYFVDFVESPIYITKEKPKEGDQLWQTHRNSERDCGVCYMVSKNELGLEKKGMQLGKYELGRTLGEGNFGKVKFARNIETGQCFAVKILEKNKIIHLNISDQVLYYSFLH